MNQGTIEGEANISPMSIKECVLCDFQCRFARYAEKTAHFKTKCDREGQRWQKFFERFSRPPYNMTKNAPPMGAS